MRGVALLNQGVTSISSGSSRSRYHVLLTAGRRWAGGDGSGLDVGTDIVVSGRWLRWSLRRVAPGRVADARPGRHGQSLHDRPWTAMRWPNRNQDHRSRDDRT